MGKPKVTNLNSAQITYICLAVNIKYGSTMKQNLILIRGLPGSGKSTLAKTLSCDGRYPVFSIDDYFITEKGDYHFDFSQNHLAYKECEKNTALSLQSGTELVFVENTFTLDWELEPYFQLAKKFDCWLHVVTVEKYHNGKNVHHVSDEQINKMAEKYKVQLK